MGSRSYQPVSDWKKQEYDKEDFSIYPDDVRDNITRYQSTTIAWASIIKDAKVIRTPERPDICYVLENYYYGWIEDINPQSQ